ncbi:hypothetical protein BH10CYA1_BH10CYA1_55940 [soil metagenome]
MVNVDSARQLLNVSEAIFITAAELPGKLESWAVEHNIKVWDRAVLIDMANQFPDLKRRLEKILDYLIPSSSPTDPTADLIQRLQLVQPGPTSFRDFENICTDILTFALMPPLSNPKFQDRSDSGANIRDLVFGIRPGHPFWDRMATHYKTRIVVAEFKNYTDPIKQDEVLCLMKYLYSKAMRTVGLLCSRTEPSRSALIMRRVAWIEASKLILFLSDDDLITLTKLKAEGQEPTQLFDTQLDDFFRTLEA